MLPPEAAVLPSATSVWWSRQMRSRGQAGVQLWLEEQVRVTPYHPSCHLFAQDSDVSRPVKQNPSTNFTEVGGFNEGLILRGGKGNVFACAHRVPTGAAA